eukprot:gene4426-7801_t
MNERVTTQYRTRFGKENNKQVDKTAFEGKAQTRQAFGDLSNVEKITLGKKIQEKKTKVQSRPLSNSNIKEDVQPLSKPQPQASEIEEFNFTKDNIQELNQELMKPLSPQLQLPTVSSVLLQSPGIDRKKSNDPQECTEYIKDIFEYFRDHETKYRVNSNYMEMQNDITFTMRGVLIDWMVDVTIKFDLSNETLYLCVNLLDRFLSTKGVSRSKLQLVGITCLWIASKYEEIYCPEVVDFVEICANAYSKDELFRMERLILTTLNFNLTIASPVTFLTRYAKVTNMDDTQIFASHFISELALLEPKMMDFKPSIIACSSIYLARKKLNPDTPAWTKEAVYYSGYSKKDLEECVLILVKLLQSDSNLKALHKKYASLKRKSVSNLMKF